MSTCLSCQKPTSSGHNYCGWDCHVADARKAGGKAYLPNGLPVGCIKHDNSMWEHEHGDHPHYKFPVTIEYVGDLKGASDPRLDIELYGRVLNDVEARDMMGQTHALIYSDGCIALTLYEHCYAMWYLRDGLIAGGSLWQKDNWKLTQASIDKIVEKLAT
jgi:hypothetical protein